MNNIKKGILALICLYLVTNTYAQTYELVWEDDFNGTSLDSSIWSIEEKTGVWNTGQNAEFQHYRKENVGVGDDGLGNNCLILTAKKEDYNGYSFTSGKVLTKGKMAFRRGKMEALIKVPDLANGLWPAFWTLGYEPIGWPDCGEIDVLEMGHAQGITDGTQNSYIGSHLFWGPYNNGFPNYGTNYTASEDLSTGYYKHTVIWDENKISVYFGDEASPYFTMSITGNDFEEFRDYQHYILFNLAVGGSLPGISNKNDITAPLPANMYIDWVKLYQEVGSEDYNDSTLALFEDYGVFEETSNVGMYMNHGFDIFDSISGLTARSGEIHYDGDTSLSFNATSGQEFVFKLKSGVLRNMVNYADGSVQFYIKSDLADDFQVGLVDKDGVESFITISEGTEYDFVRDGSWQLVYVPFSGLNGDLDLSALIDLLVIKGVPSVDGYFSVDQVVIRETVPSSGFYGIYTDDAEITNKFIVDDVTKHLYNWDNSVSFNTVYPAYEGENVLSFRSSGAQSWFGFGLFSSSTLNLQNFSEGYLNISIITESNEAFYIGMDTDGGASAVIDFDGSNDPYGFQRSGNWQHLSIPMSDLVAKGLDLSTINHVFKTGGASIGNIAYDHIYLSEELQSKPSFISDLDVVSDISAFYNARMNLLQVNGIEGDSKIAIYNIDGRSVYSASTNQSKISIDMQSVPSGIYILRVFEGDNSFVTKFIK